MRSHEKHPRRRASRGCPAAGAAGCAGRPQHDPHLTHALHDARLREPRSLARSRGISAEADSGERRPAADAGEAAAQSSSVWKTGARRLHDREGAARNPAGVLSRRQPLPSARPPGAVSGNCVAAWPLAVRPAGKHGPGVGSWQSHQSCQAGIRRFLVRHDRSERQQPDPASLR